MRKFLQTLAAGSVLLGAACAALAVNIGGLNVPVGPTFSAGQIYENLSPAGELSGYGKMDSLNSTVIGSLCIDCELTYTFSGYTVTDVDPSTGQVKFTGGTIKFYLGSGLQNDFTTGNAGGSVGDLSEATNGTLFLTLKGHAVDAAGNTFIGTVTNINTLVPTGFGTGLADVDTSAGGIANAYFNTNSMPATFGGGPADFQLGASFTGLFPVYPGECPGGAACLRGSVDFITAVAVIPEPETYALMLVGMGLVGLQLRRKVKASAANRLFA